MSYILCVDFGSTFTKVCVLDLLNAEMVFATKRPTTVNTDARIALNMCFDEIKQAIGIDKFEKSKILASSSAAGGLRMVVVGLTKRFSLLAGKNVALGAGARLIKTYENFLNEKDISEIEEINPEIILLCGGIEYGDTEREIFNADMLRKANITSYIVYAGNSEIAGYVRQIIKASGKECYISENVFPQYGELNARPTGLIIRELFMNRITGAKGLSCIMPIIDNCIVPTPAAVLKGGNVLAQGLKREVDIEGIMMFDVGGATTDVYSYIEEVDEVKHIGVPEPFAKRTVEGDLGVRSSCKSLLNNIDVKQVYKEISEEKIKEYATLRVENNTYVPKNLEQLKFDNKLAEIAIELSSRRHCGRITNAYAKNKRKIIEGKDLRNIDCIIGTGGPIIHSKNPKEILENALAREMEDTLLLPRNAEFYIDKSYILYAIGLCADLGNEAIFEIARKYVVKV